MLDADQIIIRQARELARRACRLGDELFWIIRNGIRFTGMPAFDKVESTEHVWDLVNYVRTLSAHSPR